MQIYQRVKQWTDDEDQFIIDNYLEKSDEEIGLQLQRSASGVKAERLKLKLIRPRIKNKKSNKSYKPTYDDICDIMRSKGYKLLSDESEYITQNSKMRYICLKHADVGEQNITVYHLKEGKGCYYCGREKTIESRRSRVTQEEDKALCELKGFEYIKTEFINSVPYIFFICNKHKLLGVQKMRRGNMNRECVQGCQYCANKNLPSWYVKHIIETNYPIDVLTEYSGMNNNIACRCQIHDEPFTVLAKYVFHNGSGCKTCLHEKRSLKMMLSQDEVRRRIMEKNSNVKILNLEEYCGIDTVMKLQCNKCGSIFDVPFSSFIHNSGRCPSCETGSLGEQVVASVLLANNAIFQPQYRFDDCRGENRTLSFDFCVFQDNKLLGLIEYQGEQHYHPVEYFGGEEKFIQQLKRDKVKREYCKINNIPLLIIPYWDFDNIENLVIDFIDKIKK